MAFWTAHNSAPHISYKMQVPFFSLKKVGECTFSEYIYRNEHEGTQASDALTVYHPRTSLELLNFLMQEK